MLQNRQQLRVRSGKRDGQALIEFALTSVMLFVLLFGIIDFCRAIKVQQVIVNLSREGANLASRGTTFSDTLNALVVSANPLVIDQKGYIILTTVSRDNNGALSITEQKKRGGLTSSSSRVGSPGGGSVNLPNSQIPQPNQTLVVAEVFYSYAPVTPIGQLLNFAMPSVLYDVAYF